MAIYFDSTLLNGHGGFLHDDINPIPDPLPANIVEITQEEFEAAFAGQAAGKEIWPGPDGKPILQDPAPPPLDLQLANLRATRDIRLAASDWTQLADAPLDSAKKAAWVAYRQALRDLPMNPADPAQMVWPVPPT